MEKYTPRMLSGKRLQNRRLILTYDKYIEKQSLTEFLQIVTSRKDSEILISHEDANEKHPEGRTYVYVDFGKALESENSKILDYHENRNLWGKTRSIGGVHPQIAKVLQHTKNIEAAKAYVLGFEKTIIHESQEEVQKRFTDEDILLGLVLVSLLRVASQNKANA